MDARGSRREPIRTCIACRRVRPKGELVRVVRGADGLVAVDPTGAAPGRGAYVCPERPCADAAVRRLGRALRMKDADLTEVARELSAVPA